MFSKIGWKSKDDSSSKNEVKTIEVGSQENISSVAFLDDAKYIVGGGKQGKIRCWRVEDGAEVGMPMDAGSRVSCLAVSRDGKWVVNGTGFRRVTIWNAQNYKKTKEFNAHNSYVYAADVSPDAKKIVTGSEDGSICVWSLPDGQRLLGPLRLAKHVVAVKVSPDGRRIAVATWDPQSVQVYDIQNGDRLADFSSVYVGSSSNQSVVWAGDSRQLFALDFDGNIRCLDTSTGVTLSKWRIHSSDSVKCIALACHGTFVATSAGSSVSFWDTTTRKRIGSIIRHPTDIVAIAISKNYDIVIGGDKDITLRNLSDVVPASYLRDMLRDQEIQDLVAEKAKLEETLRAQELSSKSKITHLEKTIQELRNQVAGSHSAANQKIDTLDETIKSLTTKDESSNSKILLLEKNIDELQKQLADSQHKVDEKDNIIKVLHAVLHAHEQQHHCEALYAEGRLHDAAESLIEIANAVSNEARPNMRIIDWVAEFTHRCVTSLEGIGDKELNIEHDDEALAAYSAALSLGPSNPNTLLMKWANAMLSRSTATEALGAATEFSLPKFLVYKTICDVLEKDGRVAEAIECFKQMQSKLTNDTSMSAERMTWELDFRARCVGKLERLGDAALDSDSADAAIGHYSNALSLDPANPSDILIRRSKAQTVMGSWEEALIDADKIIELEQSRYEGYERKYAALHGMGRHSKAFGAFTMMLAKLEQSSDPRIRNLRSQYIDATSTIRRTIQETIRNLPRVLIDTTTGHLYDKAQQAAAFEELPIYDEMRSSMTMKLNLQRISDEVKEYYRYAMLSHRWEDGEPLFHTVERISIYDLEASPANVKLQTFCSIIRSFGFKWVWSDTCCINKKENTVLQESLVAMFTWYHGSSLTLVYLRGIWSHSMQPGDLRKSIWNTRAWTYQEYVAAETVQFYTEDWKPYLDLEMFNHKDSPAIISEMEQVSGISANDLAILRPDLKRVREKLYLASARQTTLVEDIAYSLLGIFNASIPVIYGEGNRAVGRLMEHILTGSGDVTVLAWTGRAGRYNSCLPMDLTVYNEILPPHISRIVETTDMERMVTELRSSTPDLPFVETLYDMLHRLPSPSLAANRLRLPGIVFPITELVRVSDSGSAINPHIYSATTSIFGDVEIKTRDELIGMDLCLVHPWIRTLLDQEFLDGAAGLDKTTKALRLVARVRQPFGALLFARSSRVEYKRVAADCLIMVQVCEETPLTDLIEDIRTIEVH